jgi:hypothetical protein
MTPEQKVKWAILKRRAEFRSEELPLLDSDDIDAAYEEADESDDGDLQDARSEVREGEIETGLRCDSSRHYESKAVAAKMSDGTWVGWTYWYGGGKHGEPEGIDWMGDTYDLDCKEEEKVVTVRTFTKPAPLQAAESTIEQVGE